MKIPRIISTAMNAIGYIAAHEKIIGVIRIRRGNLIKNKLRHLDLFSGIGGFSLGLEATGGFETVAFCEIEEFPRQVLQKHWPHVKQYKDIKELTYDKLKADGLGSIDIITGGYPCQPFSQAGRKKGEQDPRHLWPEYFRLVKECRPNWVIGENVSGHLKLGLDSVLADLEGEGYATRTFSISAASIGANHKRERVWIVANANGSRNQSEKSGSSEKKKEKETGNWQDNSSPWFPDGTDSIVSQQESTATMESMENTRQSSGGIESSRNTKSSRRGTFKTAERSTHTNKITRSSERAETLANTATHGSFDESERNIGSMGKKSEGEKEAGNQSSVRSSSRSPDMADANSDKEKRNKSQDRKGSRFEQDSPDMANTQGVHVQGQHDRQGQRQPWRESWWAIEPDVGRVAHGIPARVDRLKALGNSLVPHIPYYIGLSLLEVHDA